MAVPILLAMGALVGAVSGALIAYVRLPAIIVGLCGLFVLTGRRAGDPAHPGAVAGQLDRPPGRRRSARSRARSSRWRCRCSSGSACDARPFVRAHVLRRRGRADGVRGGDQRRRRPDRRLRARRDVRRDRRPRAHRARALGRLLARASAVHAHRDRGRVARRDPRRAAAAAGWSARCSGATCIFLIQNLLSGLEVSAQWLDVVYGCVLIGAVILSSQLRPRRLVGPRDERRRRTRPRSARPRAREDIASAWPGTRRSCSSRSSSRSSSTGR